ncbi:MAG: DUF1467 family protein [Acetobacteraceae bacterium]
MNWFTGIVLYVIIWWTALFAVLPLGTRPVQDPDSTTGWRGAPEKPQMWKKVLITTVVSGLIWLAAYWLISSDYLSFRQGILAPPPD